MTRQQRLEGIKFNRLTVKEYMGKGLWRCECECGNEVTTVSSTLKSGNTKSCGCYKLEKFVASRKGVSPTGRLPGNDGLWNQVYRKTKKNATVRDINWELTVEDVKRLGQQQCSYCASGGSNVVKDPIGHGTRELRFNGIDRLDSNLGYTLNNVCACCKTCNLAKHIMGVNEFYQWVLRVASKHEVTFNKLLEYAERD